jgi:acyl carrier protein
MELNDIISQFQMIFRDVLDNDDITIKHETTAADIEEWDSLSHIQLVVAVEKHFKVKFTTAEIRAFNNVGEMAETTLKKIAQ